MFSGRFYLSVSWSAQHIISDLFFSRWEEVVESTHSLSAQSARMRATAAASSDRPKRLGPLQVVPPNWTIEHDEDLAQFIGSHMDTDNEHLGSIKNYVNSIHVSSFCVSIRNCLTTHFIQTGMSL